MIIYPKMDAYKYEIPKITKLLSHVSEKINLINIECLAQIIYTL